VQSSVKDNNNINERIDRFIIDFYDEIVNLKEETIKNICDTRISIMSAPFQTIAEESVYHLNCIYDDIYINKKKVLMELFKNIKKEEIISFYEDKFLNRKSLVIKIEK
jgi:secreted Zn-dependent insulinase-like peptidase